MALGLPPDDELEILVHKHVPLPRHGGLGVLGQQEARVESIPGVLVQGDHLDLVLLVVVQQLLPLGDHRRQSLVLAGIKLDRRQDGDDLEQRKTEGRARRKSEGKTQ